MNEVLGNIGAEVADNATSRALGSFLITHSMSPSNDDATRYGQQEHERAKTYVVRRVECGWTQEFAHDTQRAYYR